MEHNIGKAIAELRRSNGWTQIVLAEKLGVSDKAVSKWESGRGFPEITLLPVLSELFNVTIDYLITGKNAGSDIIVMSRLEYCAKTDDARIASEIDLSVTDENGKTLIDYISEYESPNVFAAICDRDDFRYDTKKYGVNKIYKYALITNKTHILDRYNIKKHNHVDDKGLIRKDDKWFVITDELLDVIALDSRINADTISYLLSKEYQSSKLTYLAWFANIPHLLHRCYLHGKTDLVDLILEESEKSNAYAYNNLPIDPYKKIVISNRSITLHTAIGIGNLSIATPHNEKHFFVRVFNKTLDLARSRKDSYYFERFSKINDGIASYCPSLYDLMERCELF